MKLRRVLIRLTVFRMYLVDCRQTAVHVLMLKYPLSLGSLRLDGVGTSTTLAK
jgi:hypothetical protein